MMMIKPLQKSAKQRAGRSLRSMRIRSWALRPQTIQDDVERIIRITEAQSIFWRRALGWAPLEAAHLLSKARLDWQVALSRTLTDYLRDYEQDEVEARQILGYVTLRTLVEGTMKLCFSVWFKDYMRDVKAIRRKGAILSPDEVSFEQLKCLYLSRMRSRSKVFLNRVQFRGNAIHAFKHRDIGTYRELKKDITRYLQFLISADDRLPYPDDFLRPSRA